MNYLNLNYKKIITKYFTSFLNVHLIGIGIKKCLGSSETFIIGLICAKWDWEDFIAQI